MSADDETELRKRIEAFLDVLDERERKIVWFRFGLDGKPIRTLEAIAKDFGVTRERIRQIQNIALSKLRRELDKIA